ncbi:MAG: sialate O-acetylesterase [Gemmatimonadales bacterium]|jgi:hypothetical protein
MNRYKRLPIELLLFAIFFSGQPARAQTTYDLYFLGGQSNMDGFGKNGELPEHLVGHESRVMIFHGNPVPDDSSGGGRGIWAKLRPGHGYGFFSDGSVNHYSERFGVELTFAERMSELDPNARIALIKYSRGGTSIDAAAAGPFGSWDEDYGGPDGVNQYDHFLATVRNAMAIEDIDGDGIRDQLVPAGIVWMQGESDAAHTVEIAERYQDNLAELVDLIRAAFRVDDLPVVIGRISDSGRDEDGKVWDHGGIVRAAQAAFVEEDGAAALVTTTDRYDYSDTWHYDSAGFLDLGRRFAEALFRLRKSQ